VTLFDFARGLALEIAIAVFVSGVLWRLLALLLLPWARDKSIARAGAPPATLGAARGFVRHLWPPKPFVRTFLLITLNGYVFHSGLAVIVFGFAPHILFLRDLFGLSWPNLPNGNQISSNATLRIWMAKSVSYGAQKWLPATRPVTTGKNVTIQLK